MRRRHRASRRKRTTNSSKLARSPMSRSDGFGTACAIVEVIVTRTRPCIASLRLVHPSGAGCAPSGELVAGGGRPDQPADQPAAAERKRREHVPATITPHPRFGRRPVARRFLRETPDLGRHPEPPGLRLPASTPLRRSTRESDRPVRVFRYDLCLRSRRSAALRVRRAHLRWCSERLSLPRERRVPSASESRGSPVAAIG